MGQEKSASPVKEDAILIQDSCSEESVRNLEGDKEGGLTEVLSDSVEIIEASLVEDL